MTIKPCPECGKNTSTTAKTCPHCGAPVAMIRAFGPKAPLGFKIFGTVIIVAFAALVVYLVTSCMTAGIQIITEPP